MPDKGFKVQHSREDDARECLGLNLKFVVHLLESHSSELVSCDVELPTQNSYCAYLKV